MNSHRPNFFLVGAVKSGTTSLYYYLNQHPQVFMSPVKEPHYFSFSDMNISQFRQRIKERIANFDVRQYLKSPMKNLVHRAYISAWEDYIQLFKNVKMEVAIGEASTSYLWSPTAAQKIKEKIPEAKLIFLLRNPIERTFSHYLMDLKNGLTSQPFAEALEADELIKDPAWGKNSMYLETGMYTDQLKRYTDIFHRNQYMIILLDELIQHPLVVIRKIYRFLNIDESYIPEIKKKYNESLQPQNEAIGKIFNNSLVRKFIVDKMNDNIKGLLKKIFFRSDNLPVLKKEEKLMLKAIFESDIKKLEKEIGKDLSHWLI